MVNILMTTASRQLDRTRQWNNLRFLDWDTIHELLELLDLHKKIKVIVFVFKKYIVQIYSKISHCRVKENNWQEKHFTEWEKNTETVESCR